LDDYLAEYGQRESVSPLVMSAPTWSDDPALALGVIKVLVGERSQTTAITPSVEAERRLLDHRFLRSPRRRELLGTLGESLQGLPQAELIEGRRPELVDQMTQACDLRADQVCRLVDRCRSSARSSTAPAAHLQAANVGARGIAKTRGRHGP
jgi:hypothetical protein